MSALVTSAILAAFAFSSSPQSPASQAPLSELDADLVLTATLRFDAIRFEQNATPAVEFRGNLFDRTAWTAERINLPEKIEPGVTYRNAGITLRILGTFKNADAFLKAIEEEARKAAAVRKDPGR